MISKPVDADEAERIFFSNKADRRVVG